MKLAVKMYGSHGGELNCVVVEGRNEESCLAQIKSRFVKLIQNSTLYIGDVFKIEEIGE